MWHYKNENVHKIHTPIIGQGLKKKIESLYD